MGLSFGVCPGGSPMITLQASRVLIQDLPFCFANHCLRVLQPGRPGESDLVYVLMTA